MAHSAGEKYIIVLKGLVSWGRKKLQMISWIKFSKTFIMVQRAYSVKKNLHYPQSPWKIHFKTDLLILQNTQQ